MKRISALLAAGLLAAGSTAGQAGEHGTFIPREKSSSTIVTHRIADAGPGKPRTSAAAPRRATNSARTKREVVDIALRRLVDKGSLYRSIRDLHGKLEWEGDVDAWRSARTPRP